MHDDVDAALEGMRSMIRADGGDLRLVGVDDGRVDLELVLEDAHCRECVMPRAYLEPMALEMVRAEIPVIEAVCIADPREPEAGP